MKNIIHTVHCAANGIDISYVAYIKFEFGRIFGVLKLIFVTHIVLLFFVSRKNSDLFYIGGDEFSQHSVAEAAGTSCNEKRFAAHFKTHILRLLSRMVFLFAISTQ